MGDNFLSDTIKSSYQTIDRFRGMCATDAKSYGSDPIAGSAGGAMSGLSDAFNLSKHTEQYRHFRGLPYIAINRIATRIAGQPIHMGQSLIEKDELIRAFHDRRIISKGMKSKAWFKDQSDDIAAVTSHELLDAFRYPNDVLTTWSCIYHLVCNLLITGKSYLWIPKVDDRLVIWPLPSDWVKPEHTKDRLFDHYTVRPSGSVTAEYTVPGDEMVYFPFPDPSDPLSVISPLQVQSRAVAIDEKIQDAQYRTFENGLFPHLMIKAGRLPDQMGVDGAGPRPIMQEHQRKQLHAAVRAIYGGVVNYHEPLILDGLIEGVERLTMAPQEMDFQDSSASNGKRILMSFAMNPIIAGEIENANRATATVADELFCSNVCNPTITLISQTLTMFVARRDKVTVGSRGSSGLVVWIEECRPVDPEQNLREYTVARSNKDVTRDEFRASILNLPPMTPEQLAEIEGEKPKINPSPFAQNMDDDDADSDTDGSDSDEQSSDDADGKSLGLITFRSADIAAIFKEDSTDRIKFFGEMHLKQVNRAEKLLLAVGRRYFNNQADAVVSEFNRVAREAPSLIRSPQSADVITSMIFRRMEWDDGIRSAYLYPIAELVVSGVLAEMHAIGADKSVKFPSLGELVFDLQKRILGRVKDFVKDLFSQSFWSGINQATEAKIREALRATLAAGDDVREIAKEIRRSITGSDDERAKGVAVTEANSAVNAGHIIYMEDAEQDGYVLEKIWVDSRDSFVRPTHVKANGQRVRGADGLFLVGNSYAPYPGHYSLPAEERINCRCGVLSELVGDQPNEQDGD